MNNLREKLETIGIKVIPDHKAATKSVPTLTESEFMKLESEVAQEVIEANIELLEELYEGWVNTKFDDHLLPQAILNKHKLLKEKSGI